MIFRSLLDEVKGLQAVVAKKPEEDVKDLKDEIKQRQDEVKQLHKDIKISKSSLQNLERILKLKSSEIIILQQQLEKSICKKCGSKLINEKEDYKSVGEETGTLGSFPEQFHESIIKSCGRNGARFLNRSNHKFKSQNKQDDLDIRTCVPVLVELLKEKDSEIAKLRKEIEEGMSRFAEMSGNKWPSNTVGERLPKHRHSRRYSDLETEIRSLHVQLAEKDANIKILKCKYGDNGLSQSNATSAPFRFPSFTSQSSVSSYQDSGIMTASDSPRDDITVCHDARGNARNSERYLRRLQELDNDNSVNRHQSNKQEEEETILSDHCWFV